MGTWGHGINENDTSFDVTETFFEKYNEGFEPKEIRKFITEHFVNSLNDEEDKDNVLFPLAKCLWEICALDDEFLAKLQENVKQGYNIEICRMLGADDDFLKKRRTMLDKFIAKISVPKEKPKPRKKPPIRIESPYQAGSCLVFRYPDGYFGGAVVVASDFFNTKGSMYLMLTSIRSKEPLSFEDFEQAKIQDFEWDLVWGQAERYAAIKKDDRYYTGRIHQHSLNYNTKQERELFMEALNECFQIVGIFSKFTQILASTTWIDNVKEAPLTFDYYYNCKDVQSSELTLRELTKLLTVRVK